MLHNSSWENEAPYNNKTTKLSCQKLPLGSFISRNGWKCPVRDKEHNQTRWSVGPQRALSYPWCSSHPIPNAVAGILSLIRKNKLKKRFLFFSLSFPFFFSPPLLSSLIFSKEFLGLELERRGTGKPLTSAFAFGAGAAKGASAV